MAGESVLIVEDNAQTAELLRLHLEHAGFEVWVSADGSEALDRIGLQPPDIVLLDVMLPNLDGMEVCRYIREQSEIPVIMITARSTIDDKVAGLACGADDYMTKPFSHREVVARVQAVLKRTSRSRGTLSFDGLDVDLVARVVVVANVPVTLTPTEFKILVCFARAPQRVFRRDELLRSVSGWECETDDRVVDAHIKNLRRKLSHLEAPTFLETVFGVGYKFVGEPIGRSR